jgi:hypothetical protein
MVGVGMGWWILKNYGIKNVTPITVVEDSSIKEATKNLPTQFTTDSTGVKKQTVELQGVVQKWNPDTGIIEFTSQNKIWKFNIDPAQVTIFVPSLKNKVQELMVKEKSGLRWETAFCKGDMISVRLADSKVIFIDNAGYRSCGFKGE